MSALNFSLKSTQGATILTSNKTHQGYALASTLKPVGYSFLRGGNEFQ